MPLHTIARSQFTPDLNIDFHPRCITVRAKKNLPQAKQGCYIHQLKIIDDAYDDGDGDAFQTKKQGN